MGTVFIYGSLYRTVHQEQSLRLAVTESQFFRHHTGSPVDQLLVGKLLPLTRPSLIITEVDIMFRIIFCPVPDFMRELPVTNSGPTIISMATSASAAIGESGLLDMEAVRIPCSRALRKAPIT